MKFIYLSCALFVLVIAGAVECVEPIVEGSTESSSDSSQQEPEHRLTNGSHPENEPPPPHTHGESEHGKKDEKEKNYRNPFSYEPKSLVIVVIFVGAFLLMAFVVGTVVLMRGWACPRYRQWYESHPNLKGYLPHFSSLGGRRGGGGAKMGRGARSTRKQSATESHLELPKQDSLDNMAEIDNESFLASLENVNFSVTPPAVRRNFGPPSNHFHPHAKAGGHFENSSPYGQQQRHGPSASMTVPAPNQHRYVVGNSTGGQGTKTSGATVGFNNPRHQMTASGNLESNRDSLYL